jgi:glutathione S-transferase
MQLFASLTSPFSRKCRVVALEVGLDVPVIPSDPYSPSAAFLQINPLSKIPAFQDGALTLVDSSLIVDYLIQQGNQRIKALTNESWPTRQRARLAEGLLEAAVAALLESRRPAPYAVFIERQYDSLRRTLAVLEADHTRLISGDGAVGMAEITLGVALAYLDFRHPTLAWRDTCPQLAAWDWLVQQRPSFMATRPA